MQRPTTSSGRWTALLAAALFFALTACQGRSGCQDAAPLVHAEPPAVSVAPVRSVVKQGPRSRTVFLEPGRGNARGHVLYILPGAYATDGQYDLAIHFHGNTEAVAESYRLAKIRAALVIVNLGEGADRYEQAFPDPGALSQILRKVGDELERRGVPNPQPRRLALSAWSAGYGAVLSILQQSQNRSLIDAVLLFDGMHARYLEGTHKVDPMEARPFMQLAEEATANKVLFLVTHSAIQPVNAELASVRETADLVLEHVGVKRTRTTGLVTPRKLDAIRGVYSDKSLLPLRAANVAVKNGLMVIEYGGTLPEHHIAHLLQMSQIGLPRLALRWKNAP